MQNNTFKSYDELPLMLSVSDLMKLFGISRSFAYELARKDGFPALELGKRIVIPKDQLLHWIQDRNSDDLISK